jgi:hypothetical protein
MSERNIPAKRTAGPPTAAPPPSLTESQRRLLADPFRMEGEGAVDWQRPSMGDLVRAGLGTTVGGLDNRRVETLVRELDRGLHQARPAVAEWCVQKMFVLPTQNGTGVSAALMADNFIDVCGHFPEDIWQSTTLELLKTCTWRPSPAQFVAIAEPRHLERKRMLDRVKTLLAPPPEAPKPFEPEPRAVRLRSMRDSYRKHGYADRAAKFEIELAAVEGREPEDWIRAAVEAGNPASDEKPDAPPTRPPSPEMRAALDAAVAKHHRAQGRDAYADLLERRAEAAVMALPPLLDEPPPHDGIPEAMEMGS